MKARFTGSILVLLLVVPLLSHLSALFSPGLRAAEDDLWDHTRLEYPELREIELPDVGRSVLPNGMVVYLLEDHEFPVVQGRMLVRVGSTLDPADKIGLARMTGTVLRTGGSGLYPGDEVDRRLESIGASVEFSIGETQGSGSFWSLRENADEVLGILADVIRDPAFPDDKLELAKVSLRREIAGRNDEPLSIVFRELGGIVWGKDHPYARYPEYATVEAVTREDLVDFHRRTFFPDRVYLTIWGDFDAKQMEKRISELFADWQASGTPAPGELPVAEIRPGGGLYYAEKTGMTNAWVVMGHVGIRADDPDYAAMNVLSEILGGGEASRLFNDIRSKRGLAYAAGSSPGTAFPRPRVFLGYAGTRSDSALVVLDLMRDEIRRIASEEVTESELKTAKDTILNSYVFQYASKGQIAARMAFLDFYGYPADFTARYPEVVEKLGAADLLAAAERNIHPDDLQVLVVGNQADFAAPLSSIGPYKTIDLTIPEPPETTEIPPATPENLARGRELLERAIESTGGAGAWASLRDLTQEMEMTIAFQGQEIAFSVRKIGTADDRDYVVQRMPFGELTLARVGREGWKKTPNGVQDLTAEEMDELIEERARELWWIFAKAGDLEAQALGREEIEGQEVEAVLVTGGELGQVFLYVDPETGLPIALKHRARSLTGVPVEQTKLYSDFREVGPVKIPYSLRVLEEGEPYATGTVTEAAANQGVDESLFARPES